MLNILFAPIRWLVSFVLGWLMTLLVIVAVLIALAGFYMPWVAQKIVTHRTGFELSIGKTHMNLFMGDVALRAIHLTNSPSFAEKECLQIEELAVQVTPWSWLQGTVESDHIIINIDSVTWVKNSKGQVNFTEFANAMKGAHEETKPSIAPSNKPTEPTASQSIPFHIKKIVLRVGKVTVIDMSGMTPSTKVYELNYQREFTDITQISQLTGPLTQDFIRLGLGAVIQGMLSSLLSPMEYLKLPIAGLQQGAAAVQNVAQTAAQTVGTAVQGVGSVMQDLFKPSGS